MGTTRCTRLQRMDVMVLYRHFLSTVSRPMCAARSLRTTRRSAPEGLFGRQQWGTHSSSGCGVCTGDSSEALTMRVGVSTGEAV